ncbi:AN1-type zinc finger protein 4 isoform X2 [Anolis carolinensis]|uniref:AN1-type zinc finger protein 4 isoform X2 n=1 Tax=Anolis carolinensis TaxID=28377 RepID=UPI000462C456|nr:PREDICTED: AN1-type zinc finger protein 4 isoform X2 [Anolis carolinensis]|eukprot:XP_008115936.1 PREDICTED: AN1-type zinc finger protein 4 isoform X2 [Anolis carolinensis]
MASKKEPPFFNEDTIGTCHCELAFYDIMEIIIETLTGTCFELRVSPFETVISVKSKIQRLEGIPVSQQHLIWNDEELEDDYGLNDYEISEGCTLKLILAMRGGPINTRRVPVADPIREITEYMDPSQDDLWEKIPSNNHATFLVYREGDQLNFFRIVDRGDGTLTPISESLSAGSVYNLCTENNEDKEPCPSSQQMIENSITMNKMKLLKMKMENINLSKKPNRIFKVNPHPPNAPRSSNGSVTSTHRKSFRTLPHIPSDNLLSSETSQKTLSVLPAAGRRMPSISSNFITENNRMESIPQSQSISNIATPQKVTCVQKEDTTIFTDTVLPILAPLKSTEKNTETGVSTNEKGSFLYPDISNVNLYATEEKVLANTDVLTLLGEPNFTEACSELYGTGKVNTEHRLSEEDVGSSIAEHSNESITKRLTITAADNTILSSHDISCQRNAQRSPLHCTNYSAPIVRYSPQKPQIQSKCLEVGNLKPVASPNILQPLEVQNSVDSSYPRTSRFHCDAQSKHSVSKRPETHSKKKTREITGVPVKASKDPVFSVNNGGFLSSMTQSTNRNGLKNSCGTGRFWTSGTPLTTDLQHFQEERFSLVPSYDDMSGYLLSSGVGLNGNIVNTGKRASDPTHFPPVNGSAQSKKKITNHCFFCGKKTGLSTSYEYVETISVPLTAMQRLTHVPMTTRMQGGGICRRPIPSSQHQSSLKSKPSFVARICFLEELLSY